MKKLKEKDLELNPDVVTNLTGRGDQIKAETTDPCQGTDTCGVSVAVACSVSAEQCEYTKVLATCAENCATNNCTLDGCLTPTCYQCGTVVCGTSMSQDIQCCDTINACNLETQRICPVSDGCESTTVVCAYSDDCPPVFPSETNDC